MTMLKKIETISDGVDVSGDIVIGNEFKYTTTGDGGSQLVLKHNIVFKTTPF